MRQKLLSWILGVLGGTIKWFAPFMKLQKIWAVIGGDEPFLLLSVCSADLDIYTLEERFVRQKLLSWILGVLGGTIKWFAPFMKLQKIWAVIGGDEPFLLLSVCSADLDIYTL